MIEDLMTLQAEEKNAEIERVKDELISDSCSLADAIWLQLDDDDKYGEQIRLVIQERHAEMASILYQCESIFADLFNGKTLEEIGKRRNLQPFRILESIRKDCHELVERCVVAELTDKFGSDE